jgi:hypothetical protein
MTWTNSSMPSASRPLEATCYENKIHVTLSITV